LSRGEKYRPMRYVSDTLDNNSRLHATGAICTRDRCLNTEQISLFPGARMHTQAGSVYIQVTTKRESSVVDVSSARRGYHDDEARSATDVSRSEIGLYSSVCHTGDTPVFWPTILVKI